MSNTLATYQDISTAILNDYILLAKTTITYQLSNVN